MALKALMLRKRLDGLRTQLTALKDKDEEFKVREAELAQSIEEVTTDEERTAVEEAVSAFETERENHEQAETELEGQIADLEEELRQTPFPFGFYMAIADL